MDKAATALAAAAAADPKGRGAVSACGFAAWAHGGPGAKPPETGLDRAAGAGNRRRDERPPRPAAAGPHPRCTSVTSRPARNPGTHVPLTHDEHRWCCFFRDGRLESRGRDRDPLMRPGPT
ncbi:hypothetical protein GCM10023238_05600 [Streptomyces heliomycini]